MRKIDARKKWERMEAEGMRRECKRIRGRRGKTKMDEGEKIEDIEEDIFTQENGIRN